MRLQVIDISFQCVIYESPPPDELLERIPGGGIPSTEIVIAHLRYLSSQGWNSSTDLESFMRDVLAVYGFLEEKDSSELDQKLLEEGRLWCNQSLDGISTASKDQFRQSWMDAKGLRIALVEKSEQQKFAASVLNGFPNLLKAIGLQPLPPPLPPQAAKGSLKTHSSQQQQQQHRQQKLWEQGHFCDVELNIRGEKFKAHRLVLAAASGYWERVFTGGDASGQGGVAGEKGKKLDIVQNCSRGTVLAVLRWMYSHKLPDGGDDSDDVARSSARLTEYLKLANEWEMLGLRQQLEEELMALRANNWGTGLVDVAHRGAGARDRRWFNTIS